MAINLCHAPQYVQHRDAVAAVDPVPASLTNKRLGVHSGGYEQAHIQVLPSGGADPDIEVLVYSDALGQFIATSPALAFSGAGADTPYEVTVPVRSRVFYVRVTAIAAGTVDIHVAGSELDHLR